ncbi:hypothetical protein [Fusobacterium ulcerans]|uniref:hypothetical protein n=1 Tax=Fusobacterium ulcerans TaxID=861 RepID=UPI0026DB8222|nr:hypothetical protein [Fusobacterium ulcerans]
METNNFIRKTGMEEFYKRFSKKLLFYGNYKNYTLIATIELNNKILISVGNMGDNIELAELEINEIMQELELQNKSYKTWKKEIIKGITAQFFELDN